MEWLGQVALTVVTTLVTLGVTGIVSGRARIRNLRKRPILATRSGDGWRFQNQGTAPMFLHYAGYTDATGRFVSVDGIDNRHILLRGDETRLGPIPDNVEVNLNWHEISRFHRRLIYRYGSFRTRPDSDEFVISHRDVRPAG